MMISLFMVWKCGFVFISGLMALQVVGTATQAPETELWIDYINEQGVIDTGAIFGVNAEDFTVCGTTRCASEIIKLPTLAEKMVIFLAVNDINSDPYFYYYMGMIYDHFQHSNIHILIVSVSHTLPGGPYEYEYMRNMLINCGKADIEVHNVAFCEKDLPQLHLEYKSMLSELYHENLALVVLADNILNVDYVTFAKQLHQKGLELPTLIHLNHEQPWQETPDRMAAIKEAYEVSHPCSVLPYRV